MHELALTEGIISIVQSESRKHGFKHVLEISLKVGEYSGVIPECIEEFFPIASKGTPAEGARLIIESVPAVFECPDCRWRGRVEKHGYKCPECSGERIKMIAGRDFFVENLKVDSGEDSPMSG